MVARVLAGYGRIDVLVNNAGAPGPIVALNEMTGADWHAVFASNVDSVFYAVHEVLPCMMRNHYGRIINVSSSSLRNPPPLRAAYMASKAAVETLSFATSLSFAVSFLHLHSPPGILHSKSVAKEVGRYGITVNCVAPSMVHTAMMQESIARSANSAGRLIDDVSRELQAHSAVGRFCEVCSSIIFPTTTCPSHTQHNTQPEEVANAVVFLASKESAVITGTVVEVNGCTL